MTGVDPNPKELGEQFLKSLDKTYLGAAASKLFAASIGDMVVVLSRSSVHKHYSLADIEWMVLPPVFAGQFYIAEAADKERGFRAPIAVVTWAFVSEEVDRRLTEQGTGPRTRLRPDEWKCGETAWLIDAIGNAEGVRTALQWLAAGPFKERLLKITMRGADPVMDVTTLQTLLAEQANIGSAE
ncbi:toxin-activating lysine-acyltransferase [Bradyrhizobium sp. LTSP885]|uniref:toxin-activating lysine-acyltransferase n=1 Tax=Bradyrhizobium sp. LTSP885 TaxID=1619232 RepID=UPI00069BE09E|nr:toxin-activating lysine-acyltransferase [Bradyrhizobium sp. LTSP885]